MNPPADGASASRDASLRPNGAGAANTRADLALADVVEEEDCRSAETIVYEDGKAVAFLNCSPATIMDETIQGIVAKTASEIADWAKRYGP